MAENAILGVKITILPVDYPYYIRHTYPMVTPDPRPNVDARDAKLSPQPEAQPTALEALRIYIRKWSKQDKSLEQYDAH